MMDRSLVRGIVITLISFLLVFALLLAGLTQVGTRSNVALTDSLKASVLRAAMTCYAVEGRYPADAGYLEAQYGLTYDHRRYIVSLDTFADNLLPDISVMSIGEV